MVIERRSRTNFIFVKEFIELHYVELRDKLKHFFPKSGDVYSDMCGKLSRDCTREIINSNLLTDECQRAIENEIPDKIIACTNQKQMKITPITLQRFVPLYVAAFACIASLLHSPNAIFSATIVILPLVFYIRLEIMKSLWKGMFHRDFELMKKFVSDNRKLHETVGKSLKFIHDAEVVSFGYTMVNAKLPMSAQLQKSQIRSFKDCMKLRRAIYKTTRCSFTLHRNLTLDVAMKTTNKSSAMLLCEIPLKQLGPCFDESLNESEIAFATDNFCTSILRDLHKFLFQQRSELLRMMLVNDIYAFDEMKESCLKTSKAMKFLEDIYDCFYRYKTNSEKDASRVIAEQPSKSTSEMKELNASLRSAQMHLRNALDLYISVQEMLNETEPSFDGIVEDVKESLLKIKSHQESEMFCRDEFDRHLMKMLGEEDMETEEHPKRAKIDVEEDGMDVEYLRLDDEEDFMEDATFEGETDEVEMQTSDKENDAEIHIGGKRKREKATRDVMRELASVLSTKTSHENREVVKAKLFPRYKTTKASIKINSGGVTACLNGTSNLLKVPRRPIFPRNSKSRKIRQKSRNRSVENEETNKIFTPATINFSKMTTNGPEHPRIGFGLGFTSTIAAQAAAMATQINRNDDVIGDVISDSDEDL